MAKRKFSIKLSRIFLLVMGEKSEEKRNKKQSREDIFLLYLFRFRLQLEVFFCCFRSRRGDQMKRFDGRHFSAGTPEKYIKFAIIGIIFNTSIFPFVVRFFFGGRPFNVLFSFSFCYTPNDHIKRFQIKVHIDQTVFKGRELEWRRYRKHDKNIRYGEPVNAN